MKKIICLLGHNKHLMKFKDCSREEFENENRKITVFTCRHCGKDVAVYTNCLNAHFVSKKVFN